VGRPEGIISKLDYVKSLGNRCGLAPIYASQMMTMDMTSATIEIMSDFGTMEDFDVLLNA
jgi:glycosidase